LTVLHSLPPPIEATAVELGIGMHSGASQQHCGGGRYKPRKESEEEGNGAGLDQALVPLVPYFGAALAPVLDTGRCRGWPR